MVLALAGMAAAALVQAMVTDGWEGVRHKVARLFGRGQPDVAMKRQAGYDQGSAHGSDGG